MTADIRNLLVLIVGIVLISGSFSEIIVWFISLWKGLVDA